MREDYLLSTLTSQFLTALESYTGRDNAEEFLHHSVHTALNAIEMSQFKNEVIDYILDHHLVDDSSKYTSAHKSDVFNILLDDSYAWASNFVKKHDLGNKPISALYEFTVHDGWDDLAYDTFHDASHGFDYVSKYFDIVEYPTCVGFIGQPGETLADELHRLSLC